MESETELQLPELLPLDNGLRPLLLSVSQVPSDREGGLPREVYPGLRYLDLRAHSDLIQDME